jgi:hypothetical protein
MVHMEDLEGDGRMRITLISVLGKYVLSVGDGRNRLKIISSGGFQSVVSHVDFGSATRQLFTTS